MQKPVKLDYLWAGVCMMGAVLLRVPIPEYAMKNDRLEQKP